MRQRNSKIKSSAERLKKEKEKLKKKDVLSKAQVDALIKKITKLERSIERDATEARGRFSDKKK